MPWLRKRSGIPINVNVLNKVAATVKQPTKDQWDRALKEAYSGFWRQQPSTGLIAIEMSMEEYEDSEIYLY